MRPPPLHWYCLCLACTGCGAALSIHTDHLARADDEVEGQIGHMLWWHLQWWGFHMSGMLPANRLRWTDGRKRLQGGSRVDALRELVLRSLQAIP